MIDATKAISQANCPLVSSRSARRALIHTKPIEIVANAKGSPTMLAILPLLRLGEFILYVLKGLFSDGEYSDL